MDKKQKIALILLPILAIAILAGGMFMSNRNRETYTDGIYIGEGEGYGGTIKVEVEVADEKIVSIYLLEHGESAGISDPAIEGIPKAIIEAQDTEVETMSGATYSSNGIMEAVQNALAGEPGESEKDKKPEPKDEEPEITQDISDMDLVDGTYEGTGEGFIGDIKVEVEVKDGKVYSVEVLEHDETEDVAGPAIEGIPSAIVEAQSVEVDTESGATYTSKGIIEAVRNALK